MSEAQPLHHQAFVYLRGVYGDDPRLVDIPQETAVDLFRISSVGFRDTGAHPSIYMGIITAVTAEYVQGKPPEEISEQLKGRNNDPSQIRLLVADLAIRVASAYQEVYEDKPHLPAFIERLSSPHVSSPREQLPAKEQDRLFDILREEERRRTELEKQTGMPQPQSTISQLCYERIVESLTPVARDRARRADESSLDSDQLDQIARQALMAAVWEYTQLPDQQEFIPFAEEIIDSALQQEIDERRTFVASAQQFAKVLSRLGSPEAAREPPNAQAQYYIKQVFGDNVVIHEEMTQYDAEDLLGVTFRSIYKEHWHRRHQDALRTVEITEYYVRGVSPEEIAERFGLTDCPAVYYVDDLAGRVRISFEEHNERKISLSDFWKPFNERVHDYLPPMLHLAIKLGSDAHAATLSPEDAVNEAIVKVLGRVERAKVKGESPPFLSLKYFAETIRKIYIDHARNVRTRTTKPYSDMGLFDQPIEDAALDVDTLDRRLGKQKRRRVVAAALAKITSTLEDHPQRELLWAAWAGKSTRELADRYSTKDRPLTPGAVKAIIYRTRAQLHHMVESGEIELPPDFYSKEVVEKPKKIEQIDPKVVRILQSANSVSAQIIRLWSGLEDGVEWTYEAIGERFGITASAARQRARKELIKIQERAASLDTDKGSE